MIKHYTCEDIYSQWAKLINRRQKTQETIIHFFDDFIRLSATLNISESILVIIFIDNLLAPIKLDIRLRLKQTHGLHDVLEMAKNYEIVTKSSQNLGYTREGNSQNDSNELENNYNNNHILPCNQCTA